MCEDMPMGCRRYLKSWLSNRFDWLDPQGRPIKPDWRRMLRGDPKVEDAGADDLHDEVTESVQSQFSKEFHKWGGDSFTVDHHVAIAGKQIAMKVVSLEFGEISIVPEELQEYMKKSLKEREMEKELPKILQKKSQKKLCVRAQQNVRAGCDWR